MLKHRSGRQLVGSAVSTLLFALAACSGGAVPTTGDGASVATPVKKDRVLQIPYAAEINGGLAVSFKTEKLPVRVLTLTSDTPDFVGLSLLSVGPSDPILLGEERYFRVAFDLTRFSGDGKYEIRAGSPSDLAQQAIPSPGQTPRSPDQSNVLVQYWTVKPAFGVEPQTFNHTLEPCPVQVSRGGLKGTLRCAEIIGDNGSNLSIFMSWG